MSESLYRKYRPKNFSEVIGQQHIVRTLFNAVKNEHIAHAYLFTGPRGTGKTSLARILAKTINCEKLDKGVPCEKCKACELIDQGKTLDIIEIDAASNTGVDNIRELRETVALPPTFLKYKVYIIDEVHMLSTGAFNALLKTLEEPPAHVIFILATTEIHKVPETILSRVQRFDFSRLPIQNIVEKLSLIAKAEKVKIDKESLEMIAIAAEGGMRDAESLLGQIISLEDKNITAKDVEEILGTTDRKIFSAVAKLIVENDTTAAIEKINELMSDGYDLQVFGKSLINYFRQLMLIKINEKLSDYFTFEMTKEQMKEMKELAGKTELVKIITTINLLLDAQGKIASSVLPQLPLEIAIIKATGVLPAAVETRFIASNKPPVRTNLSNNEPARNFSIPQDLKNDPDDKEPILEKNEIDAPIKQLTAETPIDLYIIQSKWNQLLTEIQPFNHSLKALLLNCQAMSVKGKEITLATPYDFYKERLNENDNRLTVEKVFGKILGCSVIIKTIIDKTLAKKSPADSSPEGEKEEPQQDSLLSSAMEIMGGKVVEE